MKSRYLIVNGHLEEYHKDTIHVFKIVKKYEPIAMRWLPSKCGMSFTKTRRILMTLVIMGVVVEYKNKNHEYFRYKINEKLLGESFI